MQWKDRSYGKKDTSRSKIKDIAVYFEFVLSEIRAYCLRRTKVRHFESIFLANNIKKVYLSYFRYKTTLKLVQKSNHG